MKLIFSPPLLIRTGKMCVTNVLIDLVYGSEVFQVLSFRSNTKKSTQFLLDRLETWLHWTKEVFYFTKFI